MKITAKHLFELAGIPVPYILLIEGYKEATAEFSAISPDAPAKIEQFRALVNKNQAQGDERNIDYWRKQGWEAFVAFIDSKSGPTKTALKRKKVVGQSITLREDDEWLIVIPLDKDASCFHGKNSDWCTTKYNHPHFEKYFYDKKAILIYCLNKQNSGMWAIARYKQATGGMDILDQQDKKITAKQLKAQTGLDAAELVELALAQSEPIVAARDVYKQALADAKNRVKAGESGAEIDATIAKYKFQDLAGEYVKKHGNRVSEEVQKLAVEQNGLAIQYIKNPSDEVQKLAVRQNGLALEFLNNPSDEVQKLAVRQRGWAIEYIKNPSEELQRLAVQQVGQAIQSIKNPSDEVQKLAVRQNGLALEFLNNPSDELQKLAVRQNGLAIDYIKNPSEELQMLAIQQTATAIAFIKNPSEELWRLAIQRDMSTIAYAENPSEEVQMLAIRQEPRSIELIKNPTPAAQALHNELWGA
jgi:hypothetical protein